MPDAMTDLDRSSAPDPRRAHPITESSHPGGVSMPASGAASQGYRRDRRHGLRWLVALLTTLAMLLGSLGLAAFAQTGDATGPEFLPADTFLYAEARLDLPGDQREQLMTFLGHFPGLAVVA
jgi:hypothetical protein